MDTSREGSVCCILKVGHCDVFFVPLRYIRFSIHRRLSLHMLPSKCSHHEMAWLCYSCFKVQLSGGLKNGIFFIFLSSPELQAFLLHELTEKVSTGVLQINRKYIK